MYKDLKILITEAPKAHDFIIFSHKGTFFTSGVDFMDQMDHLTPGSYDPSSIPTLPAYIFMKSIIDSPLFIFACIRGSAIGIGATFLLHCDSVLALPHPKSYIWFPFSRACLPPEFSSSVMLPKAAGRTNAADALLFGDRIPFPKAADMNLLRVTSEGEDPLEVTLGRLREGFQGKHNFGKTARNYVELTRGHKREGLKKAAMREVG
ncbi:hypothetical protein TrRE_jg6860 [Triparma retinervis]|uniref:ClpP/crotonase n=1 Tax=Triparma retinervis TaxID=2557542 RepID=A0A9W7ADQ3_9STRA|nr:hypothetical protein TrRE_jg6860 [Triparma retinervis]